MDTAPSTPLLTTDFPNPETLELRFELPVDWDGLRADPSLLAAVLDALLVVGQTFPAGLVPPGRTRPVANIVMSFSTPGGDDIIERELMQLCAYHPELHDRMRAWVRLVNPTLMPEGPTRPRELFTSIMAPAGSLAIVPLALRDEAHVPALTEHLRGVDLDHETFQGPLIAELVRRHGLTPSVLELIALRAVDKAGQNGFDDLRWLVERGGLDGRLATPADRLAFAALVDATSQRVSHRALYVAQAGKHLFANDPEAFAAWLSFFEEKGLAFGARDREHGGVQSVGPRSSGEQDWEVVWDDAANCTDLD